MSFLESQANLELTKEDILWVKKQRAKQSRSPRIREVQKKDDRENYVSILKIVAKEGHMYKKDIMDITGWTLSQYSTRMTKLYKEHKGQIKYNKNLKRIDKVTNPKKQEKLKLKNFGIS